MKIYISFIVSFLYFYGLLTSLHAKDLSTMLRGNTLSCGYDFFYFSPKGEILWSDGFKRKETIAPINNHSPTSESSILKVKFTGPRIGNIEFGKTGNDYWMIDTTQGNEKFPCIFSEGMKALLNNRHEAVRETVCGNDPSDACMKELVRLCGKPASEKCATKNSKNLKRM